MNKSRPVQYVQQIDEIKGQFKTKFDSENLRRMKVKRYQSMVRDWEKMANS